MARVTGVLLAANILLAISSGVGGHSGPSQVGGVLVVIALMSLLRQISGSARVFLLLAGVLGVVTSLGEVGPAGLLPPLAAIGFVVAFFSVIAALREVAATSASLVRCGRYFTAQAPGRRYVMLTIGGHLFSIMLSYGALSLLGGMAERASRDDGDHPGHGLRMRRMLAAIQRGLVACLCWSPVGFPMALAMALLPGAEWSAALPFCALAALILMLLGWLMDRVQHPRTAVPAAAMTAVRPLGTADSWRVLWPLCLLLTLFLLPLFLIQMATGLRPAIIAMVLIPPLCLAWIVLQEGGRACGWRVAMARGSAYLCTTLPGYGTELAILATAGFIGSAGAHLAAPLLAGWMPDLPPLIWLLAILWIMPLTGQIGMNPIMTVSLLAPLLPPAVELGLSPDALVLVLTSGWALSGASSPFTATTLLLGRLGGVSARVVGWRWNGGFTLISGAVLSILVILLWLAGALDAPAA